MDVRFCRFAGAISIATVLSIAIGCKRGGGSGAPPPAAPTATIVRGPYLQLGLPQGVSILWTTSEPVAGAARILRADGSLEGVFAGLAATMDHAIAVTGLEPGTAYTYRILADGQEVGGPFRLRTFPPPDSEAIRFVAFGDCGMGSIAQEAVADAVLARDPLIALITGDVVYPMGAAEDYGPKFFEPYREILNAGTFIYPALGNHDYYTGWAQPYLDAFALPANNPDGTERWYSFDAGPCHFVAVDSNWPFDPGTSQHEWLDADLTATDRRWKVVYFHHPPYGTSMVHDPDVRVQMSLVPLFDAHGVDLVLSGHNHNYERMFPLRAGAVVGSEQEPNYVGVDGTLYVVTGGGGAFLYPQDPDLPAEGTAFFAEVDHFVEVEIDGDVLRLRAIDARGDLFDEMSFQKS